MRLRALEERRDRVDDRVIVVDDGDQPPLVEGSARVGDSAAERVADGEWVGGRHRT